MTALHAHCAAPAECVEALGVLDAAMDRVKHDAGSGASPEHQYALLALQRQVRALAGDDPVMLAVAGDVRDAALRALDASDPGAALVTLELAYCSLRGLLKRHAGAGAARASRVMPLRHAAPRVPVFQDTLR